MRDIAIQQPKSQGQVEIELVDSNSLEEEFPKTYNLPWIIEFLAHEVRIKTADKLPRWQAMWLYLLLIVDHEGIKPPQNKRRERCAKRMTIWRPIDLKLIELAIENGPECGKKTKLDILIEMLKVILINSKEIDVLRDQEIKRRSQVLIHNIFFIQSFYGFSVIHWFFVVEERLINIHSTWNVLGCTA